MIRRTTGWLGELLLTAGVLVLLFVGWQLWWTDVVANDQQQQIVKSLVEDFSAGTPGTVGSDAFPDLGQDTAFAVIRVPRFGADYVRPVIDGTARPVLALGVGHYDGTAAPGAVGNFAVAGHRTTYGAPFHDIDRLRDGDRIIVETGPMVFVYEVTSHEIVRPQQIEVIAAVPDEPGAKPTAAMITMTSCHPKFSALYRYITHGKLVKSIPRAQWRAAEWMSVGGKG